MREMQSFEKAEFKIKEKKNHHSLSDLTFLPPSHIADVSSPLPRWLNPGLVWPHESNSWCWSCCLQFLFTWQLWFSISYDTNQANEMWGIPLCAGIYADWMALYSEVSMWMRCLDMLQTLCFQHRPPRNTSCPRYSKCHLPHMTNQFDKNKLVLMTLFKDKFASINSQHHFSYSRKVRNYEGGDI